MHWLVEVSRVGDTAASERYCIDARRWQSALQEARRLRGDSGPLPKLTIELLDEGYRAVDPALKVRYLVTEAPPGMPLTDSARVGYSTAPPPVESGGPRTSGAPGVSGAPASSSVPAEPLALAASAAPPAAAVVPAASTPPSARTEAPPAAQTGTETSSERASSPPQPGTSSRSGAPLPILAQVIKQRDEKPTEANPIAYRELALSVRPGALREDVEALLLARLEEARALLPDSGRYVQIAVFDHMFVKRPVRAPLGTLVWKDWRGDPQLTYPGFGEVGDLQPPPSLSTRAPSWMARSDSRPSLTVPPQPPVPQDLVAASVELSRPASVGSERRVSSELPRPVPVSAPVAATKASVHPPSLASAPIPRGKSTPPLGSAAVNPVPSVAPQAPRPSASPASSAPSAARPELSAGPPSSEPSRPSVIPSRVVSIGPSSPPRASASPPTASAAPPRASAAQGAPVASAPPAAPTPVASAPPPSEPTVSLASSPDSASEPVLIPSADAPSVHTNSPPAPVTEEVAAAAPVAPEAPKVAPASASVPAPAVAMPERISEPPLRSEPSAARRSEPAGRRSDPMLGRRRAPGEDLIGDLFENIHELSFLVDLVSGADFVARTLAEVIPCEAIAVHAFDLGRREFVVVRVRHPSARKALLHRTPDADPIVREIMRHRSLISNGASPVRSGAFAKLGVEVKTALTGAVRQGGRYLGLIELVNPAGGTPFHEGEASALEYVCEQFADFVASRPIVLDADVVLGH